MATALTTALTSVTGVITAVITAITSNDLLMLFVALGVTGSAVGIVNRLKRV